MKGLPWIFLFLLLAALTGALLLPRSEKEEAATEGGTLAAFAINEVEAIHIKNRHDAFSVLREEGGFILADLPMDQVNAEYLFLLLDESSRVEYQTLVSEGWGEDEKGRYGFDDPEAVVTIRYADASVLSLVFGAEEPVSRGRYFTSGGGKQIYLMERGRVVRFLQPLKNFINYEIVPPRAYPSPLSSIAYLRLSGGAFPRPIVISRVDEDSAEDMRTAASFGAASHLVRSPALHEIDQKECIEVFSSLTGLLNIEVFGYNLSDEELADLGFNRPWVVAEYDYQRSEEDPLLPIVLRVVRYQGDFLLIRDDQRVVHRIENKAFISTAYEKLVMRWFLTPFITDLQSIRIEREDESLFIRLSGEDNASLKAVLDGKPLDIDRFRKFYRLLISASNDGVLLEQPVQQGPPLLEITFAYRDGKKAEDTLIFRRGSLRRLQVTVNGVTEFSILERYLRVTKAALEALAEGRDFSTGW
jgi:hypothetical protein